MVFYRPICFKKTSCTTVTIATFTPWVWPKTSIESGENQPTNQPTDQRRRDRSLVEKLISRISGWWQLKYFSFSPLPGEDDPILTNTCQRGWFNHQLVFVLFFFGGERFHVDIQVLPPMAWGFPVWMVPKNIALNKHRENLRRFFIWMSRVYIEFMKRTPAQATDPLDGKHPAPLRMPEKCWLYTSIRTFWGIPSGVYFPSTVLTRYSRLPSTKYHARRIQTPPRRDWWIPHLKR